MSIAKAISDAIKGTLADQWLDIIRPEEFDERDLVVPGVLKTTKRGRGSNLSGSEGVITNGSVFHIPEGAAACVLSSEGIEEVITFPGHYVYHEGQKSVLAGDGIRSLINEAASRIPYGGITPECKRVVYVNLKEICDIRFGTSGPQPYYDAFYGIDLEVVAHGTFSIEVTDPETVLQKLVPTGVKRYSLDDDRAKAQLVSEVVQSLVTSIGALSGYYRFSESLSHLTEITSAMENDENGVGSWQSRFGIRLVKVSIRGIELTDASRKLVKQYSANRMGVLAYEGISSRAGEMAAQQLIAKGISSHGLGGGGAMLGVAVTQTIGAKGDTDTFEKQASTLMSLKELLDSGVLTQEEFNAKKREVLGLP